MAIDVPDWLKLTQLAAPGFLTSAFIPVGQLQVITTVTLSPFATGIIIVPVPTQVVTQLSMQGGVSLHTYFNLTGRNYLGGPVVQLVPGTVDNPLTIDMTINAANPGPQPEHAFDVYQLFGTGVEQVLTNAQQPLVAQMMPGFQDTAVAGFVLNSVSVSSNLAASGTATFLAGVAGERVVVYGWQLSLFPAAGGAGSQQLTVQDTANQVVLARLRTYPVTAAGQILTVQSLDIPMGLAFPVGAGLKAVASAANAANTFVEGTIYYTQS